MRAAGPAMDHQHRRARPVEPAVDADVDPPALDRHHRFAVRRGDGLGKGGARQEGGGPQAGEKEAAVDLNHGVGLGF